MWEKERHEERGVERLGPVSEGELLEWEAVVNGRGIGGGYEGMSLLVPILAHTSSTHRAQFPPWEKAASGWELITLERGVRCAAMRRAEGGSGTHTRARTPSDPFSKDKLLTCSLYYSNRTEGRWLLRISIPTEYPNKPPKITFVTPIVHANIALQTGEICLDLLKDAWTPAYGILETIRAIRMLLSSPETDSPLNVDVAALIRAGDHVGARRLVEFWVNDEEGRFTGP